MKKHLCKALIYNVLSWNLEKVQNTLKKNLSNYCTLRWISLHDKLNRATGKNNCCLMLEQRKNLSSKRYEMLQVVMNNLCL